MPTTNLSIWQLRHLPPKAKHSHIIWGKRVGCQTGRFSDTTSMTCSASDYWWVLVSARRQPAAASLPLPLARCVTECGIASKWHKNNIEHTGCKTMIIKRADAYLCEIGAVKYLQLRTKHIRILKHLQGCYHNATPPTYFVAGMCRHSANSIIIGRVPVMSQLKPFIHRVLAALAGVYNRGR